MIDVTNDKRRVAIIGGGISGLTAAYYLQEQAKSAQLPIEIVLIEASHRFGGKIQTIVEDGYQIEKGPDSFTDHKGTVATLAKKLKVEKQLVRSKEERKFVAVNEELHAVPKGVQFGIPTEMTPFLTSDLVSWSGKARATFDFLRPQGKMTEDQSLGQWVRQRLGGEVLENLTEPLLSGIYNGDIDELSLQAVLPFLSTHSKTSSGLIQSMKSYTRSSDYLTDAEQSFSFVGGLETFVDALIHELTEVKLKKSVRVTNIQKSNHQLLLSLNNQSSIKADAVIIATSHTIAQSLFHEKQLLQELDGIPLNTVATVSLAFDETQIAHHFTGTDFVVSRNNDLSITAATFMNRKWQGTAPNGKVLIKAYIGRVGDEAIVELSDKGIEKVVLQDLHRLVGITGAPEKVIVTRYKNAMPQYTIGHLERVRKSKESLYEAYPTIRLIGNTYDGISIPKCVRQAIESAEQIMQELKDLPSFVIE
ncbi:protoporphyrinogen oxidase [Kurthia sp. 11kri321]|nr:protoporphyrinogen oxidase [Kurthia sp. 11kri321]